MRIVFLIALACSLRAQAVFNIDASESRAAFTLPDVLHTVHVVDAASGESGNGARDKRMHQSILESQKFPEIVFVPSRVRGGVNQSGESKVEIDGTFTIHGASHPLTATAVVNASGDRLQAKVHFVVPYVAWGMKNPSTLFLRCSESVEIDLDASGHVAWSRN
jgi:polyisoprenoid-binding protein YceI